MMTYSVSSEAGHASIGKCLGFFAAVLIGANVVLIAVTHFFPNFPLPNSFGIVLLMIAAMSAGQSFVRQSGRKPTGSEKLVFMLLASVLSAALTMAGFWGLFASYGIPFTLDNVILAVTGDPSANADLRGMLPVVLGIAAVVTLLMTWLGFGLGARSQLKQMERAAAKAR